MEHVIKVGWKKLEQEKCARRVYHAGRHGRANKMFVVVAAVVVAAVALAALAAAAGVIVLGIPKHCVADLHVYNFNYFTDTVQNTVNQNGV